MPLFAPFAGLKQNRSTTFPVIVWVSAAAGACHMAKHSAPTSPAVDVRMFNPSRERCRLTEFRKRLHGLSDVLDVTQIPPHVPRAISLAVVHLVECADAVELVRNLVVRQIRVLF